VCFGSGAGKHREVAPPTSLLHSGAVDLPTISDGTVTLRPFAKEDEEAAVRWVSGPESRTRSQTDGGPRTSDEDTARTMVADLRHGNAYAVLVDDEPQGWMGLRFDGKAQAHLQLVLAEPRLWVQGIGARTVRLICAAAFDHLGVEALRVNGIAEAAEPARCTWENAGFGLVRRYIEDEEVHVDFHLSALCRRSNEQQVFLVRHGRTANEDEGRLLGRGIDAPLDGVGRAQAEALSLCGIMHGVVECVTSPLKRARATAESGFAAYGVPCTEEDDWSDRDWGEWTGQPWRELPRDDDGSFGDPPHGESEDEFRKRVAKALHDLPHGEYLAVVTHGANIATAVRRLQPQLADAPGLRSGMGITPGSITELRRGPEGWRVIRLSDDRHQQARKATADMA